MKRMQSGCGLSRLHSCHPERDSVSQPLRLLSLLKSELRFLPRWTSLPAPSIMMLGSKLRIAFSLT